MGEKNIIGWQKCSDRMPAEDEVVFWYEPARRPPIFIGVYADNPEVGLVVTRTYEEPIFFNGIWYADDAEWDNDYQPTHWHPFPISPRPTSKERRE